MKYDTFSAGVEPGGLRTKQEIKVLICYMLVNIKEGINKNDLLTILQANGIANYFEAGEAFSDLLGSNNIKKLDNQELYNVTNKGKMIAEQLSSSLPKTVKERALDAVKLLFKRRKIEKENKVSIEKTNFGYNVTCNVSGGDFEMMSLTLYVPDMEQAKLVQENFYKAPEMLYRAILSMLTQKNSELEKIFENTDKK